MPIKKEDYQNPEWGELSDREQNQLRQEAKELQIGTYNDIDRGVEQYGTILLNPVPQHMRSFLDNYFPTHAWERYDLPDSNMIIRKVRAPTS